ncbi:hypothetical protein CEXT_607281 [Caerostris extrusa]|uniref:Uncharacterized protein n=1 Tax=Caerostris extrusa TaxID=172846 RepID=A0AAV4R3S1_CAEEX|nr:hypothetical protein CEXT_607281 [Caerostris extrusa]
MHFDHVRAEILLCTGRAQIEISRQVGDRAALVSKTLGVEIPEFWMNSRKEKVLKKMHDSGRHDGNLNRSDFFSFIMKEREI